MLPLTKVEQFTRKHLRYNVTVSLLDGGFFGVAIGFASFSTILPLFVASMTDSATLIGLVPAIHARGMASAATLHRQSHGAPASLQADGAADDHPRARSLLGICHRCPAPPQNWITGGAHPQLYPPHLAGTGRRFYGQLMDQHDLKDHSARVTRHLFWIASCGCEHFH